MPKHSVLTILKDLLLLPLAVAAMAVVLLINLFTPSPLNAKN